MRIKWVRKLKIILLPGMDGTGKLFEPFRSFLPASTVVVSLPQSGSQAYSFLAAYIAEQLPNEKFIIVAESFSGPIAALLTEKSLANLKGIVFVATFLSCPMPVLVSLAKRFPLKSLLNIPFAKALISRYLLADFNYSIFSAAIKEVPNSILKERLSSIRSLNMKEIHSKLPSIYISAKSDCLISSSQIGLFQKSFPNLQVEYVQGKHFLLQSNPKSCSEIIRKFVGI
jgi:pimeloyl-[acyl-carrier protein] methyl ester esterase